MDAMPQQSALILPFKNLGQPNDPYDLSEDKKNSLDRATLQRWLIEIKDQPEWRMDCNTDAAYYDGYQMDGDTIQRLIKLGFPEVTENLIQPTVDLVLGMEAKSRTDWLVKADNSDKWTDVADAMSMKLKEAEREAHANDACGAIFESMVKTGVACGEVGRNIDPFQYPYRVLPVHRNEIAWDWKFRNPDQSDMRYFLRWKWFDPDALIAMFPRHEALIRMSSGQWSQSQWLETITTNIDLAAAYVDIKHTTYWDMEWRDRMRGRLLLTEVWYRTWNRGPVLKLPDGRTVIYDKNNRDHVNAVGFGLVKPIIAPYSTTRMSYWIGPNKLEDVESPYPFRGYPYVLFFAYREDNTGRPYGLARKMRPQQDEINARKMKMAWLLAAKRVIADEDAVDDHEEAKEEVSRSDAYIMLSKSRKPDSRFEVESDFQLTEQQFKVYQQARQAIQDVAGVYQALLGKEGAADSGIAINHLIEQGTTTLAKVMTNYMMGRTMLGQRLMELVRYDIGHHETVIVGEGSRRRHVNLNVPYTDDLGPGLKNDVLKSNLKVVLDDIPHTPTFREQTRLQLSEVLKSMPPEAQAVVAPWFIELTDFKDRHKVADVLRKQMGMPMTPTNPQEEQEQAQAQQEQAAVAQLKMRDAQAEVAKKEAEAEKTSAEAKKVAAEAAGLASGSTEAAGQQLTQLTQKFEQQMRTLQDQLSKATADLANREREIEVERDKAILDSDAQKYAAEQQAKAQTEVARLQNAQTELVSQFTKQLDAVKQSMLDEIQRIERENEKRESAREVKEAQAEKTRVEREAKAEKEREAKEQKAQKEREAKEEKAAKDLADKEAKEKESKKAEEKQAAPAAPAAPLVVFEPNAFNLSPPPSAKKITAVDSKGNTIELTVEPLTSGSSKKQGDKTRKEMTAVDGAGKTIHLTVEPLEDGSASKPTDNKRKE